MLRTDSEVSDCMCMLTSGFFLTCDAVPLSYNVFSSLGSHIHIIKERFVCIYNMFPCLQELARLKIALNILAHVPKSLLDPALSTFKNRLRKPRIFHHPTNPGLTTPPRTTPYLLWSASRLRFLIIRGRGARLKSMSSVRA